MRFGIAALLADLIVSLSSTARAETVNCAIIQACAYDKCFAVGEKGYSFQLVSTKGWVDADDGAFRFSSTITDTAHQTIFLYPNGISIMATIGNDGTLVRTTHIPRGTGVTAMRTYQEGETRPLEFGPDGASIDVIVETGLCEKVVAE